MKKYQNKYTQDAYSIKTLKKEAKILAEEQGLKLSAAQHLIAKSCGYSDWNAIVAQKPNKDRDNFYREMYKEGLKDWRFLDYIEKQELESSKENLRKWMIQCYQFMENSGYQERTYRLYSSDGLLQVVSSVLLTKGLDGFLPQNLSNDILQSLLYYWRSSEDDGKTCIVAIVASLLGWSGLNRVSDHEFTWFGINTLTENQREIIEGKLEVYIFALIVESTCRSSNISLSENPTLENILDEKADREFIIPQCAV